MNQTSFLLQNRPNSISKFFTWFWIIYIPTCILFYRRLPDYIDEFMSLTLILFALANWKIKRNNTKIKNEYKAYIGIMIAYVFYSFLVKINTTEAIFYDLQQQLRPYLVFYSTYILAPRLNKKQYNRIITVALISNILFVLLTLAGIRVGSFGLTTPVIAQGSLLCGLLYYLNNDIHNKQKARIALLILSLGLVCGKSKFVGEYVVFIAVIFFLHQKLQFNSLKTNLLITILGLVVLFFTWTKFDAYYVSGFQAENISDLDARPAYYRTAVEILFKDYIPLGSGLASFATATCAKYYSPLYYHYGLNTIWGLSPQHPMFIADAFYPTLAQYGLVGVILFIIFWIRRYKEIYAISELKYYKVGFLCMFALFLESVADTSYLSGKGMGYFILMAMCIREEFYFRESMKQQRLMEAIQSELIEEQTNKTVVS